MPKEPPLYVNKHWKTDQLRFSKNLNVVPSEGTVGFFSVIQ